MEKFIKLILNKGNVHLAIILAVIFACFSSLNAKMDVRFAEMDAKMTRENTALRLEISDLRQEVLTVKNNDIAHIYAAIEALTFTMVKNKLLTQEDKEYIDSRLKNRP